jgi:hypothetical protein
VKTLTPDERLFLFCMGFLIVATIGLAVFFEVMYGGKEHKGRIEIILKDDGSVRWERKGGDKTKQ